MAMKSFIKKPGEVVKTKEEVQDKAIEFIKGGNVEGLAKMLEEGSKERKFLNRFHTKSGKSSLMVAAEEGRIECVQLLLDNFVNIDLVDRSGMTAFLYASLKGESDIVEMLANGGADIHMTNMPQNENAILLAAKNNHLKTIEYLVTKEIAVDLINSNEETALTTCIKFEYYKTASYLLANNANINVVGRNGNTCLLRTGFDGRVDSTAFILSNGGDVNAKNVNMETPLMLACRHNHLSIVRLLLAHKDITTVEDKDLSGKTALMISCMMLRVDIIKLLLQYEQRITSNVSVNTESVEERLRTITTKIDVNTVDVWGYSALIFAVNACNLNAVWSAQTAARMFADAPPVIAPVTSTTLPVTNRSTRISVNKGSNSSPAAVLVTAKAPKVPTSNLPIVIEVISLLLAAGAHVNGMDRCFSTPLMHACMKGMVEVAEALLNRGADPWLRNIDDKLAVDLLPVDSIKIVSDDNAKSVVLLDSNIVVNDTTTINTLNILSETPVIEVFEPSDPTVEIETAVVLPTKRELFLLAVEQSRDLNSTHSSDSSNNNRDGVREKPQWINTLNAVVKPVTVEDIVVIE